MPDATISRRHSSPRLCARILLLNGECAHCSASRRSTAKRKGGEKNTSRRHSSPHLCARILLLNGEYARLFRARAQHCQEERRKKYV